VSRRTSYHNYNALESWESVNDHNKKIVEEYLINLGAEGRSSKTIEKYTHNLKLFFQWILIHKENAEFHSLKKRDYVAWLNYLVNKQKLSPNRVRVLRSTISSLSNFCENILGEDDDFPEYKGFRNAVIKVNPPVLALVRDKTFLTKEQIEDLVQILFEKKHHQRALYVMLSYITGARKAEIQQMKISDFKKVLDRDGRLYYKTHPIRCKGRGLEGKIREFIIIKDEIDYWLNLWLEQRANSNIIDNCDSLFVVSRGGQYHEIKEDTFNSWCKAFEKIIGVAIYPHAFRGSIATQLVNVEKRDMSKVQTLLGHKSLETTQHYIQDISGDDIFDLFDE